jgi:hypothetical protein
LDGKPGVNRGRNNIIGQSELVGVVVNATGHCCTGGQKIFSLLWWDCAVDDGLGVGCEVTISLSDFGPHEAVAGPAAKETCANHFTTMGTGFTHIGATTW